MELTKYEMETIYNYNQEEPLASCYTMDRALIRRLDALAEKHKEITVLRADEGVREYTFPKKWTNKWHIENLRLYANIQNLLTITGYDGYDPEIGVSTSAANVMGLDNGRYPSPTVYSFGLNVTF